MKGHKCLGASYGVKVNCECGWASSLWYGKTARRDAYQEWRDHHDREHSAAMRAANEAALKSGRY